MRLSTFFARLGLYVFLLLGPLASMFVYWLFAGRDIISVRFKDGGGIRHTCDLYLPAAAAEARAQKRNPDPTAPVVVLIAGGAWAIGHKAYGALLCRALRRAGFLCIAVDYRYWPQVGIDGMVEDNDAAVGWALRNSAAYGGDPKRVILIGHSSGAHIGALMLVRRALAAGDDRAPSSGEGSMTEWDSSEIFGFVGLAGIYHLNDTFMGHLHQKGIDLVLQRLVFGETEAIRESRSPASLVRAHPEIVSKLPPALLIHCTGDKIVPPSQSEHYRETLVAAGATDVNFVLHEGGGHNDPVIHSPLMSDGAIVREIILHEWRWATEGNIGRTASGSAKCCEAQGSPRCCRSWEAAAERACEETLSALPSWPRVPQLVINTARRITPF